MASKPIEQQPKKRWEKPVLRKLEGKELDEVRRLLMTDGRLAVRVAK